MNRYVVPYRKSRGRDTQRGAATLVVVMILFFIMAMMAAYANRNLIFEQRIASNYYRAGVAADVADGGAEWALAMLNSGFIDGNCAPLNTGGTQTFAQRYLNITPSSRQMTPLNTVPTSQAASRSASCVRTSGGNGGWNCQCPAANSWVPPDIALTADMQPSFALLLQPAGAPGVVRITSTGCTGANPWLCTNNPGNPAQASAQQLGGVDVLFEAALISALKSPPSSPLTLGTNLGGASGTLGLHNADPRGSGLLLAAGGTITSGTLDESRLGTYPGTPPAQALIVSDTALAAASTNASFFSMFFGMTMAEYPTQPAVRVISCAAGANCMPQIQAAVNAGSRMLWVQGPLTLTPASGANLGSVAQPVILIASGAITITGPMTFSGLLYSDASITWNNNSGIRVALHGAVLSRGSFIGTGPIDLVYDPDVINVLSNATGSYVRLPGSWWDGM